MITIDLDNKVALVTGGGQGIGAAIAVLLAQAGCRVAVNYCNDPGGVNHARAADVCKTIGAKALAVEGDVRDDARVAAMFAEIEKNFGRLDIVVNNAAILRDRTIAKMTPEEWQSVIDTNLTGVFNVCRHASNCLADQGRIINLSSIAAFAGFFGQSNYAAAKAGVSAMTRVLSKELAKRGITVNAVAPGVVMTEMGKSIPDVVRDRMLQAIPLQRFAEPREIANVVLFLCSDLSSYMTGQTLHVSGGWWV